MESNSQQNSIPIADIGEDKTDENPITIISDDPPTNTEDIRYIIQEDVAPTNQGDLTNVQDSPMVIPIDGNIKVERVDDQVIAEHLSNYINLTNELDTDTILKVVSPKLFDHFTIFEIMLAKANLCSDYGAVSALLDDTACILSELKELMEKCLTPVRSKKTDDEYRRRNRKKNEDQVEVDDMLAYALCLESSVWKKKDIDDIDYRTSLLDLDRLFPEKREKTGGRPRGNTGMSRRQAKREEIIEEEDESDEYKEDEDEEDDDETESPKKKRRRKVKNESLNESIEKEKFTCEKCGKTYVSTAALYKHIEKTCSAREMMKVEFRRVENEFFCLFPECPNSKVAFSTKEDVDDHWAEFHASEDDKIIPCFLCDKKFATVGAKKVHMNRDHEKKFPCKQCEKKFFTRDKLNYHMKSHTKIKQEDGTETVGETYLCLKCGQTLCKAYGKQHEAKCTGTFVRHPEYKKMNDEFFCTVEGCHLGYGFNSIYGLRQHFHSTHVREEEKYFACDYCDEKFSFKTTRNKHIKAKHLKSYVCDICGKGFGGKDKLTSHRYTHTGEKPYACDKCDYKAAKKYNLEMHRQSKHSTFEQKNFLCAICNKQFVTMGRVRRHMQVIHAEGKDSNTSNAKKKRRTIHPMPVPMVESQPTQPPEIVHHVEEQEYFIEKPQDTVIVASMF